MPNWEPMMDLGRQAQYPATIKTRLQNRIQLVSNGLHLVRPRHFRCPSRHSRRSLWGSSWGSVWPVLGPQTSHQDPRTYGINMTYMTIWNTSSARTSRGRKFPKGKELYSTERICLKNGDAQIISLLWTSLLPFHGGDVLCFEVKCFDVLMSVAGSGHVMVTSFDAM